MINDSRVAVAPPTSAPQTSSPAGAGRDPSAKAPDPVTRPVIPADRAAEAPPKPVADGDRAAVKQPEEQSAHEMPRHVTEGFMHEATGRYVIRVVASLNSDDIIAQYPPEDLLRFYELARELQGQSSAPAMTQGKAAV